MKITIEVKKHNDVQEYGIECSSKDTILEIKQKIETITGVPASDQILKSLRNWGSDELLDHRTLDYYQRQDMVANEINGLVNQITLRSEVYLTVSIEVKKDHAVTRHEIVCLKDQTVFGLKKEIEVLSGIPASQQSLKCLKSWSSKELLNNKSIGYYHNQDLIGNHLNGKVNQITIKSHDNNMGLFKQESSVQDAQATTNYNDPLNNNL